MLGENDKKKPSALPAKKAAPAKKPVFNSDSDSEEDFKPKKVNRFFSGNKRSTFMLNKKNKFLSELYHLSVK